MTQPSQSVVFRPQQSRFLDIPQAPLCYWLEDRFFELMSDQTIGHYVSVRKGLDTADNERFVRCIWEISASLNQRWFIFPKGGGYSRWIGFEQHFVNWEHSGTRIKAIGRGTPKNEFYYGDSGLTYTEFARGCLGVRILPEGAIFNTSAPGIFLASNRHSPSLALDSFQALLNCRISSFLLRTYQPNIQHLGEGYVTLLPMIRLEQHDLGTISDLCVRLKTSMVSRNLLERTFDVSLHALRQNIDYKTAAALHLLEGFSEKLVFESYMLDDNAKDLVIEETGTPAAWFPLIQGYDNLSNIDQLQLPISISEYLQTHERLDISPLVLAELKSRLRSLYEAGPRAKSEAEESENARISDDDDDQVALGVHIPIPAETFLEELSQKLEVHPISVYWMLREGIENEGWRCLPEERRITADRTTVFILRLLGHQWPKQIEAGEAVPEWADSEGIIPLTDGAAKSPLLQTLRKLMPSELGAPEASVFEREFSAVMGKNLDQWLETEFFKHHTKQFKKRPIAWQIQSGPFSKRRNPAFACLVYYHKLNADTFPKLRTHYVGPLRRRYETELHGIGAVPLDARSERQEKRRVLLENQIQELKDFDSRLERIANVGFGPKGLRAVLRQAAIDDAVLHLKALWLDRLQDTIAQGPLPGWVHLAQETALECPIEDWIEEAFSHIAHHCSRLGPKPPDQGQTPGDPESGDLAELICSHSSEMIRGALSLGCNEWWQKIDSQLFRPFREKIQKLREENKRLNDEANHTKSFSPRNSQALRDLGSRIKAIKVQIKQLKNQLDEQVSRAAQVREAIERWEHPEAETWEPWLGSQPLYDAVSTLDGKQRPPATVEEFVPQESSYAPDINDGVRVNIAPIQKAGLLLSDVLSAKDIDKAISDRIQWRSDERRWCREGRLHQPGWW
jgi:hypothetical protein